MDNEYILPHKSKYKTLNWKMKNFQSSLMEFKPPEIGIRIETQYNWAIAIDWTVFATIRLPNANKTHDS